jgi:hypothetical protein
MNSWTANLLIACMVAAAVGCSRGGGDPKVLYRDGRAEAQKDIEGGKIMLKTYGLPAPWSEMYRSNLLSQYQIVSRSVAGCIVTDVLRESVKGYNEISLAEIERRYGTGVLERVDKETEQAWLQIQTNK